MGPIKDLGVFFDPKLKFDIHINNIVNRSKQKFCVLFVKILLTLMIH